MKQLLILILLFLSNLAIGQMEVVKPEKSVFQRPEYVGGDEAIIKTIKNNLKFPESAVRDKVYGVVKLGFTVDTAGFIKDIEVLKSVRKDLDNEAIRLLKLLKNWLPAYEDGIKKDAKMTLPFRFYPNKS